MTAVKDLPTATRRVSDLILTERARKLIQPHLGPMRMLQIARELEAVVADTPKLLLCTHRSLVREIALGVTWNLRLGETWHLVPRNVTVEELDGTEYKEMRAYAQLDYKGEVMLMQRKRDVIRRVDYSCVFEKEEYRVRRGTDPMIEHWSRIRLQDRGDLIGGYALVEWVAGGHMIVEMDAAEVDAVRRKCSLKWNKAYGKDIPLETILWYVEKTCVHRLAKRIDLSTLGFVSESEVPDIVDAVSDAEAVDSFADIPATAPVAPNSAEGQKLISAGPVATVHAPRHGDGVPVPSIHAHGPSDPYGLEAMMEAQVG